MTIKPATRLYVEAGLAPGAVLPLDAAQAHFLRNVLRLESGAVLALFNGREGEWLGRILELGRNGGAIRAESASREQVFEPDLWLVFAPIKRARLDFMVEKATELGVSAFRPVLTRRSIVDKVNPERLAAIAREAAEQCERLTVPPIAEPEKLDRLLAAWDSGRRLILCEETGLAPPIAEALSGLPKGMPAALLIGPEGGFAETELDAVRELPFVTRASLGARVLRADTAALAALAVFQALVGDWGERRHRP